MTSLARTRAESQFTAVLKHPEQHTPPRGSVASAARHQALRFADIALKRNEAGTAVNPSANNRKPTLGVSWKK